MISYLSLIGILFFCLCFTFGIDTNFKLHFSEERYFAQKLLANAIDVSMVHHGHLDGNGEQSVCSLIQKGLDLQTQEIELIDPNTFTDVDFDPETPVNIRQFVGMAHINDGIIALTSDNLIFMLKFNYEGIHGKERDSLYNNGDDESPDFASLVWKADIGKVGISEKALSQIPQLVYSFEMNSIMLVYTDSILAMNVTQMEDYTKTAYVYAVTGIIERKERGWTKCIGSLMISVVGTEGLDFYQMKDYSFSLMTTLTSNQIWTEKQPLRVTDFTVLKCPSSENFQCYHLYLMDEVRGIVVIEVSITQSQQIQFKVLLDRVGRTHSNGQILDTFDGNTLFAAYDLNTKWIIEEISVSTKDFSWQTVSTYQQRTRIQDIQMSEDFVIVQGVNHQQFFFYGQNEVYKYYSNYQPIVANFGNIRDISFFKQSHMEDPKVKESIQKGLIPGRYFDDFFFGVGKHKMFVTRYMQSNPGVQCFTENPNTIGRKYLYTIHYNTTACPINQDPAINCNFTFDFSVEVIKTLLFHDKVFLVMMILVVLGIIFFISFIILCILYRKFIVNSKDLEKQINTYKNLTTTVSKIEIVDTTSQQELSKQVQEWK